jgi:hypothetical protein
MRTRLSTRFAVAFAVAALAGASGQALAQAAPPTVGNIVLPNANGTITYQGTRGTTVENGVTVFHGTGPTATISVGNGTGPAPAR